MKKHIFILLACMTYMPISFANTANVNPSKGLSPYEKELTKLLNSLNTVTGVPGFSVAVTHKGKLVASVATGFADVKNQQPATPDTTFRLASVSKLIGATMLAELVTLEQLDPDLGIGHYYPELNSKYHHITVRQLLSHTSGLPHYQVKDFDIYDQHFTSAVAAVKTLKNRDLLSRAGSEYLYSTHGYTLAGALYEKITKQPLSQAVNNFVARWTDKTTPAIENINALSPSSSKLYELNSDGAEPIAFGEKSYSVFGAGLFASASDLALFGAKVLEKSQNESPLEQLLFTPTKFLNGDLVSNDRFAVGFGWRISTDAQGRTVYHHAGATPGARSILAIFPEQEVSIAFLSNSSWISSIDKLAFALAGLYIDNATLDPKNNIKIEVKNKGQQVSSHTSCQVNMCYLTDNTTDYANWLNTFNTSNNPIKQWPLFTYSTKHGQRLLMVTKIGITSFEGKNNVFEIDAGKHQTYSIQLTETQ